MKFRKIGALVAALGIVAGFALTGCEGSVKSGDEDTTTAAAETEIDADAETTAQDEADADTAAATDKLNVGILYISTKTDGGWSQGHAEGLPKLLNPSALTKFSCLKKKMYRTQMLRQLRMQCAQ